MSTSLPTRNPRDDRFGSGIAGAVGLHLLAAAALIAVAVAHRYNTNRLGGDQASIGAIQASMVSAIPLPQKAPPVKDSVLAPEDTSPAPAPPPKERAEPPPRPDDILIKARTPEKTPPKVAPVPMPAPPKHPQPTPPTPKAETGEVATQLPESVTQLKNGTATLTVENRTFGARYAYYLQIVGRVITRNYSDQDIDARASQGKSAVVVFDIEHDGSPANVHIETRSGSPSLDTAAARAVQLVDSFGPLPAGDHITIEYKFDFRAQ